MDTDRFLALIQWALAGFAGVMLVLTGIAVATLFMADVVVWVTSAPQGGGTASTQSPAGLPGRLVLILYAVGLTLLFAGLSAILFCLRRIADYLRRQQ